MIVNSSCCARISVIDVGLVVRIKNLLIREQINHTDKNEYRDPHIG
jgi:hypothetical protein